MNDETPTYYAIIPAYVRYDEDLPLGARLLYGEITALSQASGKCWASDQYFLDLYKVSKRTIQNWLNSLEKKGYIYRDVIYKKDSKEIDKRFISIEHTLWKLNALPYGNRLHYPMEIDCVDNNTSINNTSINNKTIVCFDDFWKLYPNKKNQSKKNTKEAFRVHVKTEETYNLILKDLERRKKFEGWIKEEGKYIPHATTYIRGHRWEDEYDITENKEVINLDMDKFK